MIQLLQPIGGHMPTTQQEYDALVFRVRQMGHILEQSPNNIMNGFNRQHRDTVAITDTEQVYMFGTGYEPTSQSSQPNYSSGYAASSSVYGGFPSGRGSATLESTYLGDYDSGDGTDSDTASSCGDGDADMAASLAPIAHLPDREKEQYIYWAYQKSKSNWRKWVRKPVRKVRRFFRKPGKGQGKQLRKGNNRLSGKGITAYVADLTDDAYDETFFGKGRGGKGRGKGKGKRSSGKGMGNGKNPRGRDGTIMKCYGNGGSCGSETHLKQNCPHETGQSSTVNYVDTVWIATDDTEDHPTTTTSERHEEFAFVMWDNHTDAPRRNANPRWQPYDPTGWIDYTVFPDDNAEVAGASGAARGSTEARPSWWNYDGDWGDYHGTGMHKCDEDESIYEP